LPTLSTARPVAEVAFRDRAILTEAAAGIASDRFEVHETPVLDTGSRERHVVVVAGGCPQAPRCPGGVVGASSGMGGP